MKCIHCGLPLSPTCAQVNCPRRGMSTTPGEGSVEISGPQDIIPAHEAQGGYAHSEHTPSRGDEDLRASQAALSHPQGSGWEPPIAGIQTPAPTITTWEPSSSILQQSTHLLQVQPDLQHDLEHLSNRPRMEPRKRKHPELSFNIGLTVAGLCVFTSALILIFVYFMALGLSNDAPGRGISQASTATTIASSPSSISSPTAVISSTPATLPGAQFIDHAQTASAIDFGKAKATTPASKFSVNQKIYVTFNLHSNIQAGAACLSWYLNGKKIAHNEFAVPAGMSRSAYAYLVYQEPGAGSVRISWASSIACSDKLLAQEVNFSVTR